MLIIDETGPNGLNGIDGDTPGEAGGDGQNADGLAYFADTVTVTSPEALIRISLTGGNGGSGGAGAAGAVDGDGGAGGRGGDGGDVTGVIEGLSIHDSNVERWVDVFGGNLTGFVAGGGQGGNAGAGPTAAGGQGGAGGTGGMAFAQVKDNLAVNSDPAGGYLSFRAFATAGQGGPGGVSGFLPELASQGLDGDGGPASAEMTGNTIAGGAGADLFDIGVRAVAGSSASSADAFNGVPGAASATLSDNIVRAGDGADEIYIYGWAAGGKDAEGGRASGALEMSGNVFDGGAGDDAYYVTLFNSDGPYEIRGNRFLGGDGQDVIDFRGNGTGGSSWIDFDLRANRVRDIEQVIGSNSKDTITGGRKSESLDGADGKDKVFGGGGGDTLAGGTGDDFLKGGAGDDWASFQDSATAVVVDLSAGTATGEGADRLKGIEGAIGSDHDDLLVGDSQHNFFAGADGDDTIVGGGGSDDLLGGDDGSRFVFNDVSDTPFGSGDRVIFAGFGDIVDLSAIDADETTDGDQAFTFSTAPVPVGGPEVGVLYFDTASSPIEDYAAADTDGDGAFDLEITFGLSTITSGNFVL